MAQVASTARGEIHREEGDIGRDVDVAQGGIELDAVERRQSIAPAHDVGAVQVAVAFADPAGIDTLLPLQLQSRGGRIGPVPQGSQQPRHRLGQGQRGEFREVVEQYLAHTRRRTETGAGIDARGAGMHGGDLCAEGRKFLASRLAALDQRIEFLARVELHHAHGVIDDLAVIRSHPEAIAIAHDRHDVEVQVRCEAAIEAQFLGAAVRATLGRRIVQEAEPQGLLDLVGAGARQRDPGNVRFDEAHRRVDGMGIGGGIEQRRGQRDGRSGRNHDAFPGFGARRRLLPVYAGPRRPGPLRSILMARKGCRSTMKSSRPWTQRKSSP